MKIGFLGPKGTFSHEAMEVYIKDKSGYIAIDYTTIPDMLLAVQNGEIDEAIAPLENSLEGAVNATLDMMAQEVELKIISEVVIPIRENLMIKKGTRPQDIKRILSHPQPLGQCRNYIMTNYPNIEVVSVYSTAGAAEEVSKGNHDNAAIGSIAAAKVYGLEIIASGIEDQENNLTRFVVISKKEAVKTGCDKTSIVFSTDDKPGSLYRILDIFNLWDVNMTRIESRPAKNKLGKYIFFIDTEGYHDEENLQSALTMIKRKTSFYKFLGSYPQHKEVICLE